MDENDTELASAMSNVVTWRCSPRREKSRGCRGSARAAAALLLAAGCSGGETGEPSSSPTTLSDVLTILLEDYRFVPAVLDVGDGRVVRVQNVGGLEHSWAVLDEPIATEQELGSATVLAEARVGVGQTAEVDLSALPAGRYQIVCDVPGHVSAGMIGELILDG